jgi:hypothetical protein
MNDRALRAVKKLYIRLCVARDTLAVLEIRIFLETYPLGPSPSSAPDQNTRYPNLKYGTAILPLWRQTTELRAVSKHWPAFTRLLDALTPFILTTSVMFSISHPEEFQRAKATKARRLATQDPALTIPESTAENCFETMRLSANIAPGRCLLQTTHPSKLACLITVGLALSSGGSIAIPALGLQFTAKPGVFGALSTEH